MIWLSNNNKLFLKRINWILVGSQNENDKGVRNSQINWNNSSNEQSDQYL